MILTALGMITQIIVALTTMAIAWQALYKILFVARQIDGRLDQLLKEYQKQREAKNVAQAQVAEAKTEIAVLKEQVKHSESQH
jgi:outer membrane protein TolC